MKYKKIQSLIFFKNTFNKKLLFKLHQKFVFNMFFEYKCIFTTNDSGINHDIFTKKQYISGNSNCQCVRTTINCVASFTIFKHFQPFTLTIDK